MFKNNSKFFRLCCRECQSTEILKGHLEAKKAADQELAKLHQKAARYRQETEQLHQETERLLQVQEQLREKLKAVEQETGQLREELNVMEQEEQMMVQKKQELVPRAQGFGFF